MRIVFFYVSHKHGYKSGEGWDWTVKSKNHYALRFSEEGYSVLLNKMIETGIVDNVLCIIESRDSPGYFNCGKIKGYVVPSIEDVSHLLVEGDVLFIRGCWKHWCDHLLNWQRNGHWLLIYAANTGRQKWPHWDIIFDDINGGERVFDGLGRLHLDFRKPVNEEIFYYEGLGKEFISLYDKTYDFMIGASRIHDKKGQWRVIKSLAMLKNVDGISPRCVLPGPFSKGVQTNMIFQTIKLHDLDVLMTNNISRSDLAKLMRQTRFFIHMGSHGQGDRGPMEALACGCELIIGFPKYHARWLVDDKCTCNHVHIVKNPQNFASVSELMRDLLVGPKHNRYSAAVVQRANAGLEYQGLYRMRLLFEVLERFPTREPNKLRMIWSYDRGKI